MKKTTKKTIKKIALTIALAFANALTFITHSDEDNSKLMNVYRRINEEKSEYKNVQEYNYTKLIAAMA